MVDEPTPLPDDAGPQPYDIVYLRPGNRHRIPADVPLTVADIPQDATGYVELHHQEDHPDYWDRAAGATLDEIAQVVRIRDGAVRSWTLTT
ncbi:DUF6211 family protein [Streptomyces sp. NPDC087850]|uniref:DUF6211 family protein n=1 Tax=Streptomyces sp. NPDC087850 TaxID=3365809 RepID=UPI0037FDA12B